MTSGVTIRSASNATKPVRAGLTTIITTSATKTVTRLRIATGTVAPIRFSTSVRSVVSLDSTSPVRVVVKKAWSRVIT